MTDLEQSRRGRNSRRKGAAGEREVTALLRNAFGVSVKRLLGQARDSGHDIDLPPFRIECKRRKHVGLIYEALGQAEAAAVGGDLPIAFVRADGRDWLVAMPFAVFARLAREEVAAAMPAEGTS